MSAILDILISLGINETVYVQFGIFIVAFLFLKIFIFSPYLAAYEERRRRTVGSAGVARELQNEIDELEATYSRDAKAVNEKIKTIFEEKRVQVQSETSRILAGAQTEAQTRLQAGKQEIQSAYDKAREQLKDFVPDLGQTIKQRLLDR